MIHRALFSDRIICGFVLVSMFILALGCTSHKPVPAEELPPAFSDTDGAISGKLVNGDGNPFDMALGRDSTDRNRSESISSVPITQSFRLRPLPHPANHSSGLSM